jgi:hypothetical protein
MTPPAPAKARLQAHRLASGRLQARLANAIMGRPGLLWPGGTNGSLDMEVGQCTGNAM